MSLLEGGGSFKPLKAVLILSGGLDSTVLLYDLLSRGYSVHAITFNYGQRHSHEIESAVAITLNLVDSGAHVLHSVIDLRNISKYLGDSALLGGQIVPECHYTEAAAKQTVVPNRNMIMLAVAAGYAEANFIPEVYYAAHAGDWAIYPDCRKEFTEQMAEAIKLATAWNPVELKTPFVSLTKDQIVKRGIELKVPFELTWSCYNGGAVPCGKCPTCVERIEAFEKNGAIDPCLK
jgi:7-cyano-7-deazaguanine synthase